MRFSNRTGVDLRIKDALVEDEAIFIPYRGGIVPVRVQTHMEERMIRGVILSSVMSVDVHDLPRKRKNTIFIIPADVGMKVTGRRDITYPANISRNGVYEKLVCCL